MFNWLFGHDLDAVLKDAIQIHNMYFYIMYIKVMKNCIINKFVCMIS